MTSAGSGGGRGLLRPVCGQGCAAARARRPQPCGIRAEPPGELGDDARSGRDSAHNGPTVTGGGRARTSIPVYRAGNAGHGTMVMPPGSWDQRSSISRGGGHGASDKPSDYGSRQRPTQRDVPRRRYPSGLRYSDPMRRHKTKSACMVRRRSTVRFRNGAPQLKDNIRKKVR